MTNLSSMELKVDIGIRIVIIMVETRGDIKCSMKNQ